MATATVVNSGQIGDSAYLAVRVDEGGGQLVEYIGVLPMADIVDLSNAEKKNALVLACKAVRDVALAAKARSSLAISGSVVI